MRAATGRVDSRASAQATATLVLAYHGVGGADELVDDLTLASADEALRSVPRSGRATRSTRRSTRGARELVAKADALARCCATSRR